jgi:prephenate dehydrogenase
MKGGAFRKAAVLGPGMIGASFSRALKSRGLASEVVGFARNEDVLRSSVDKGYLDSYELDPARACLGADLVMLSTPVETFTPLIKAVSGSLEKGAIVMDAGSVKGDLVFELEALMPAGVFFVPCHPIAGSELSGPDASSPDLFDGAYCIVTPTEGTDKGALERVTGLWESLGSRVERLDPQYHEKVYALVSHFPHMVAFAMVNAVFGMDASALRFTGAGFDDSTRIAKSSPSLWSNICIFNRDNLIECIEVFTEELKGLGAALKSGDVKALEAAYERAQQARISIKGGR